MARGRGSAKESRKAESQRGEAVTVNEGVQNVKGETAHANCAASESESDILNLAVGHRKDEARVNECVALRSDGKEVANVNGGVQSPTACPGAQSSRQCICGVGDGRHGLRDSPGVSTYARPFGLRRCRCRPGSHDLTDTMSARSFLDLDGSLNGPSRANHRGRSAGGGG